MVQTDDRHYQYDAPHLTVAVEELARAGIVVLHCAGQITRD